MPKYRKIRHKCKTRNRPLFTHSVLVRPPEEIARRVDTAVRLQRKEIEDDSRLAWYQRTSTFGIGLARLKKKLRRLLGKEK